jgi:eukaryotic-like serine/threonine-protein kinase
VANFGERYELIRRIGSGGMGEVWLAHDEQLADRPVAIKIMHQHLLPNVSDVARFEREMRFAAMMDHPNIVTVFTTGTYDGAPFMVMEYLRGQDLEKALPGGDVERVTGIGRDICVALAYAHREGVIHRDIKPSNLFLCESGQVKVTDFGVAKAIGGPTFSTTDTLLGTVAYLPPERWRGEPPAFSNDIWAVGCVLYRLISGRLPRVLPVAADYAAAAVRDDPIPDLRDIVEAPAWLTAAVMAMLASDPADRPTAADCARLLSDARSPAPVPGRLARRLHLPGQPGPGQPEIRPVIGAVTEEPAAASVTQPAAARTTPRRPRRLDRVVLAVGGVALLLVAGSITAWQLSASPKPAVVALRSTAAPAPVSPAATAKSPGTSAPAPRSSSAAAPPASATSPASSAASLPASPPSSRPAPPASSRPAPPTGTLTPSPTDSPTPSGPATSAPPVVPIPDVVGMTFASARAELISDGFRVVGDHTRAGQVVTRTAPSGQAAAGSVVIVVYGRGAVLS